MTYKPHEREREILDRAWEYVSGVPYQVTLRWVFYKLYQDGYYPNKKEDYRGPFMALMSRARKKYYGNWRPDTLADDRRQAIKHEEGFTDPEAWVDYMAEGGWWCTLDHFYHQDNYIEVWFEAEAMSRQFQYFTKGLTLRPFAGHPSIDYKYKIARDLEKMYKRYELPITILYFGDYDKGGRNIPKAALKDIRSWCRVPFDFIRCGLNEGDGQRFGIPENFEKPGSYQWEALDGDVARDLIISSIRQYIDIDLIATAVNEGQQASNLFNDYVRGFGDYYHRNVV